ncbi:hypothetical protein [Listeria costaricensis]|uniref:hypothetical protein n=1 Tax=Listeria costaricensis TaxID=2026604 RepID=UPI000C083332|nr:hypothetical protein [Listeria costaricensis]
MKKILVLLLSILLTGCANDEIKEKAEEAVFTGVIEEVVPGNYLQVNDFKDTKNPADPGGKVNLYRTLDVFFNEENEQLAPSEVKKGDDVTIFLTPRYVMVESSPAGIDWQYIVKVVKKEE